MDSDISNLEAYKIINTKLNQEVDEYYKVNAFFLTVLSTGLIAQGYLQESPELRVLISILGFIISIVWRRVDVKCIRYRDWWVEKAKEFEKAIFDGKRSTIWLSGESDSRLEKAQGVWALIAFVPIVFIFTWAILLISMLYQYLLLVSGC